MNLRRNAQLLRIASSWLAFLGITMFAGCGQKGFFYLPDSKPPVIEAPAPTTGTAPAPEKRDEEKEKPR